MSEKAPGFTPKWLKDLSDLNRKAWHNQPEYIALLRQKRRSPFSQQWKAR